MDRFAWHSVLYNMGRPFSPGYGLAMLLRARLYDQGILQRTRLPVPVISVGNLTMGGTGKTPAVIAIARLLVARGVRPAVLSRGYGGSLGEAVNVVSDGDEIFFSARQCGDEPRLLAEALPGVPVLTGKKRTLTGRHAIKVLGARVLLLDDGFQHLAIARDLDIVLFSGQHLLGNGRVFPGGDLREPVSALGRAHIFCITAVHSEDRNRVAALRQDLATRFPLIPISLGDYRPQTLVVQGQEKCMPLTEGKKLRFHAFCGLANPLSFQATLAEEGFALTGFHAFRDHHPYTEADLETLGREGLAGGAQALLTTEKDLVKIPARSLPLPVIALRIESHLGERFREVMGERLREWGV